MRADEGVVVACGADEYLRVEGSAPALHKLLAHLQAASQSKSHSPLRVCPEPRSVPTIEPVSGVAIRVDAGATRVELHGDVAWLVGGQQELSRLLDQMKGMVERGPYHWEILRALEEGYEHIDASTHIDLIVTDPNSA